MTYKTLGKEIATILIPVDGEGIQEMTFIKEENGNIFAIHSSYVDQDVGDVVSPYQNGVISL